MDPQPEVTWQVLGNTARTSVDLYRNLKPTAQLVFLSGRTTLITSDPSVQPHASFSAVLHVVRPITATAGAGPGGLLPVQAYEVNPSFTTNAAGQTDVHYRFHALPGAHVKVEAVSGLEASPAWMTTDANGCAKAAVWINTDAPIDDSGAISGRVRISATKDFARVRREVEVHIPYALVADARGAGLLERPGTLMEPTPIHPGQWLRPGDVVQVGSEFVCSGAFLTLWFCNGQRVTLTSDTALGIQAVVGRGHFDHKTPILVCHLRNLAADLWFDPRRIGRLIVYKALGNVVDGLFGIPDPVGWAITTPGGALEHYLSEWLENSPQPGPLRAELSAAGSSLQFNPALGMAHELTFWSDGTVRVRNAGAPIRLTGPNRSTVLPSASLAVARWDVPGASVSAAGQAAPLPTPSRWHSTRRQGPPESVRNPN